MRLKYVKVGSYKNLNNFELPFSGDSFIDVFVGKNGSGKSNFFEALIQIFRHLYEYDKEKGDPGFDYTIKYEIDATETEIGWSAGKLTINGSERKTLGLTPLPDNVLIYYSGHNDTVAELVRQYESSFNKRIKKADFNESRRFIGIGPKYKALLLAVLLMQKADNKAREYIRNKLDIATVAQEVKLVLQRPSYATDARFDIEDPNADRYWKPEGIAKSFLDRLDKCVSLAPNNGPLRDEGYFASEDHKDYYIQYFDISKIQTEFGGNAQDIFRQFDNLKTLGMLADISIQLTLSNELNATIAHFSDGQFQSVYIYSIVELFKDRNCLTLLDEPDAFLHPEWQFGFLKQVFEITDTTMKKNHVLMSSHSASTLASYNKRNIRMFCLEENQVKSMSVSKDYAINQLSSNMIKYSEDEQILSILHSINVERKPIFFTEGSSDPEILKEAWSRLYSTPIPFIPIYAFNCVYLRPLIQDERILNEIEKKPVFALFDFDEAYNEWNYLKEKWGALETDPYKGLSAGDDAKKRYAFLLPVPSIPEVETLVIKDRATKTHFAHKSRMGIEHLFYGDKRTHGYFDTEKIPGGNEILVFKDGSKTRFARELVPTLEAACFEVFRPMFDFIKSKCSTGTT